MRVTAVAAIFALSIPLLASGQTDGVEMHNQEVVRRFLDHINRGDAKAAAAEYATGAKNFDRPVGREGIETRLRDILTTFPDWHMEILEMTAAGEVVVVRCRVTGNGTPGRVTQRIGVTYLPKRAICNVGAVATIHTAIIS